jgi:very-short-patch-repair endonuclease
MKWKSDHWDFVAAQDRVVTRGQLRGFGWSDRQIDLQIGAQLRQLHQGVFLVGGGTLSDRSRWRAALLACGAGATLSHQSAGVVWGLVRRDSSTHVSVPRERRVHHPRIHVHRPAMPPRPRWVDGLRVSAPLDTLVDLAASSTESQLEGLVDEAAREQLINLDSAADRVQAIRRRGARRLMRVLAAADQTDSDLEDVFLELVRAARLPEPRTQQRICGFRVDFLWPDVRLVVETDGLAFHRTRRQQAKDRIRDQRLTAAGYTCLRFTDHQVRHQPDSVIRTLVQVLRRLTGADSGSVSHAVGGEVTRRR